MRDSVRERERKRTRERESVCVRESVTERGGAQPAHHGAGALVERDLQAPDLRVWNQR